MKNFLYSVHSFFITIANEISIPVLHEKRSRRGLTKSFDDLFRARCDALTLLLGTVTVQFRSYRVIDVDLLQHLDRSDREAHLVEFDRRRVLHLSVSLRRQSGSSSENADGQVRTESEVGHNLTSSDRSKIINRSELNRY